MISENFECVPCQYFSLNNTYKVKKKKKIPFSIKSFHYIAYLPTTALGTCTKRFLVISNLCHVNILKFFTYQYQKLSLDQCQIKFKIYSSP